MPAPKSNVKKRGKRRKWYRPKKKQPTSASAPASIADGQEIVTTDPSSPSSILVDENSSSGALIGTSSVEPSASSLISTDEDHLLTVPSEIDVSDNCANAEHSCIEDHSYVEVPCDVSDPVSIEVCATVSESETITDLLLQAHVRLFRRLPPCWVLCVGEAELHVMLLSRQNLKCPQRSLRCSANGDMNLTVHGKAIPLDPFLTGVKPKVQLVSSHVNEFCDRILDVVLKVRQMEVCAGVDNSDYEHVWNTLDGIGEVDNNPYEECRYSKTFRSLTCLYLVECRIWKCKECAKLYPFLRRRHIQARRENILPHARNKVLTNDQKLMKLISQREEIKSHRRALDRLKSKMQSLLAKDGVNVQEDLSNDLQGLLSSQKLSPAHSMFLQQQVKASQRKSMSGMRWHPSMIRLALAIFINSRSTYELIRDSGAITLPSSRTLFDYSHADVVNEGLCHSAIRDLAEKVGNFQENYKKYHVVMADEMFTSKNLVFHKGTGELRGYMKLNALDKEVKLLENYLDDPNKIYEPEISNKILSFLVKGVCTDIKTVVATFAVSTVSVSQMFMWAWDVIGTLERSGIWVTAFTCDGSPTNRAFIKMHTPVTDDKFINGDEKIPGSAVYVTVNKAAPHRNVYFICDVPHLLKTIRNCFNNSRMQKTKGKRHLKVNGEVIAWDTIIDLYNIKKRKMLRKSYKLNPQNVFPDAFSRMKVSLAAQVMSETVATDIEQQHWPHTKEVVRFIRLVNKWFDCLNGANTYQGRRKKNPNLDPYIDVNDSRYTFLITFVQYLDDWRCQAEARSTNLNDSRMSVASTLHEDSVCDIEPGVLAMAESFGESDETPAGKSQLSHQTILGIEITVKSFISCTRFLLNEGCPFINARVFCQDPLEQHFSKLRSGFGGSTNPNASQCINKQNTIHIMGQLGVKRKGNTESEGAAFEVTEEPMRKRKSIYAVAHD